MGGQWRATVRVQYPGPETKTTEIEACMALICASADDGKSLTGLLNYIYIDGG